MNVRQWAERIARSSFGSLALAVALVAVVTYLVLRDPSAHHLRATTSELDRYAASSPPLQCLRTAVAYNSDVDVIVPASAVLASFTAPSGAASGESDAAQATAACDVIDSADEMLPCLLPYFAAGRAVERYVSSPALWAGILATAAAAPNNTYFIGGNAALVAHVLATLDGCDAPILLGGPVGKQLAALLAPRIVLAAPAANTPDEFHLILEYLEGEVLHGATAPRANRIILHSDLANARLAERIPFHTALPAFNPELVVISGMHLLETRPEEDRAPLLTEVAALLSPVAANASVHLELASMADVGYVAALATALLPRVHSLGLNEQELDSLSTALSLTSLSMQSPGSAVPSYAAVSEALAALLVRSQSQGADSLLSRVHFHSLAFHMLCQRTDVAVPWASPGTAVAAGARSVAMRACNVTEWGDGSAFKLLVPPALFSQPRLSRPAQDVLCVWQPVPVCRAPVRTVGLGDSISAIGLLAHPRVKPAV
eukprot:c10828_g1_i1.p1 GENE.c10828_g1_i1~~c10828_g1_i1.p1  ORF type:complete len:508 (+),score=57.08 c10828_g1_i1:63-1526(+)